MANKREFTEQINNSGSPKRVRLNDVTSLYASQPDAVLDNALLPLPSYDHEDTNNHQRMRNHDIDLRTDCPYLDTVNQKVLDFDFEKFCSVSLSKLNVYACLVCGKYFQGRGQKSHAYIHGLEAGHHVYINLSTERVYCLPDGHEMLSAVGAESVHLETLDSHSDEAGFSGSEDLAGNQPARKTLLHRVDEPLRIFFRRRNALQSFFCFMHDCNDESFNCVLVPGCYCKIEGQPCKLDGED